MTVNTKGFVLTRCKDVFFVCQRIEHALNELLRPGARAYRFAENKTPDQEFRTCSMALRATSGAVGFTFTDAGDTRTMTVNFECDIDQKAYGPESISISMGCRGKSDVYVKTALQAISMLGDVYFDACDSDEVGPALLELPAVNFISACEDGSELGSCVSLARWSTLQQKGDIPGTPERVLGMSAQKAFKIMSSDYDESARLIGELVDAYKESTAEPAVA